MFVNSRGTFAVSVFSLPVTNKALSQKNTVSIQENQQFGIRNTHNIHLFRKSRKRDAPHTNTTPGELVHTVSVHTLHP